MPIQHLAGACEKMQPHMIRQNPDRRIQNPKLHVQQIRVLHTVLRSQHAPSLNLFFLHIGQIDRYTLSCAARFPVLPMNLNTADLTLFAYRIHLQRILPGNRPGHQRPGDDRAEA